MGIKKEIVITKGWKAEDNERFGPCVVILFKDEATGATLFQYAPCHEEKDWWVEMFEKLYAYDRMVKGIRQMNDAGVNPKGCQDAARG